jgi:hypothetical protein
MTTKKGNDSGPTSGSSHQADTHSPDSRDSGAQRLRHSLSRREFLQVTGAAAGAGLIAPHTAMAVGGDNLGAPRVIHPLGQPGVDYLRLGAAINGGSIVEGESFTPLADGDVLMMKSVTADNTPSEWAMGQRGQLNMSKSEYVSGLAATAGAKPTRVHIAGGVITVTAPGGSPRTVTVPAQDIDMAKAPDGQGHYSNLFSNVPTGDHLWAMIYAKTDRTLGTMIATTQQRVIDPNSGLLFWEPELVDIQYAIDDGYFDIGYYMKYYADKYMADPNQPGYQPVALVMLEKDASGNPVALSPANINSWTFTYMGTTYTASVDPRLPVPKYFGQIPVPAPVQPPSGPPIPWKLFNNCLIAMKNGNGQPTAAGWASGTFIQPLPFLGQLSGAQQGAVFKNPFICFQLSCEYNLPDAGSAPLPDPTPFADNHWLVIASTSDAAEYWESGRYYVDPINSSQIQVWFFEPPPQFASEPVLTTYSASDVASLNYTFGFDNLMYTAAISIVGDTTNDGTPATVIRGGCANYYGFLDYSQNVDQIALTGVAQNNHRFEWHNLQFLDMLIAINTTFTVTTGGSPGLVDKTFVGGPISTTENCWFENMYFSGGAFPANFYTYPNRTAQRPNDFSGAQTTIVRGCTYKAITYCASFFGSELLIENNTIGPHQSPAIFANDGMLASYQWLIGALADVYGHVGVLLCQNVIVTGNTFTHEMPNSTPQNPVYGNMVGLYDSYGDPNYYGIGFSVLLLNTFVLNASGYNVGPALGATVQNVSIYDNTFIGCQGGDRSLMSGIYVAAQGGGPEGGGGGTISSVAITDNTFIRCSSMLISATTCGIHNWDVVGGPIAWNGGGTGSWTNLTIARNVIIDQLRQGQPDLPGTTDSHTLPCIDLQGLATTGFGGNSQIIMDDFTRSGMLPLTDARFANDPGDASCVYLDAATSGIVVQENNCLPDRLPPEDFITNLNPTGNQIVGGKSNSQSKTLSDSSGAGRRSVGNKRNKQMRPVFVGFPVSRRIASQ